MTTTNVGGGGGGSWKMITWPGHTPRRRELRNPEQVGRGKLGYPNMFTPFPQNGHEPGAVYDDRRTADMPPGQLFIRSIRYPVLGKFGKPTQSIRKSVEARHIF